MSWVPYLVLLSLPTALCQQFAGDVIPNQLPSVPGSEIAYWRIKDPSGKSNALTLTNYWSRDGRGARLVNSNVKRGVIILHGLNRDPGTYMSNILSALSQTTPTDPNVNFQSVQMIAPYFANGNDKNYGYPWTDGLKPGRGSVSNALVWAGSQWSAGANNQYPYNVTTVSSFEVLDQIVQYFDDRTRYPNLRQIVVAGHSLGGQTISRYAQIGNSFPTNSPVTYWIGNPNSYTWMATSRPLDYSTCPTYDTYRDGFTNFTQYPMTYAASLVASGRQAIISNFNSKSKAFVRGTQDLGDDSSSCAPVSQGANRNERFFNFIKAFPASCADPANGQCDTIDYVNAGHDAGAIMASPAGQARLFLDNFYGDGKRAYDFGYPRLQAGDDPFPDPTRNSTTSTDNTVYAGNMTSAGCWTDNTRGQRSLPYQAFDAPTATIQSCTSACSAAGYSIAGTEFGSQCFCGNSLGPYAQRASDAGCTQTCAGNSSQVCGNGNRLSLYSNGVPNQLPIPGTPETVGNYNSLLCYAEATSGRALSATTYSDGTNMTLESCAAFCNGYKYFGVEFGAECYCGSYLGAGSVLAPDSDCSMVCPGNQNELCGAGNRLNVYQLQDGAPVSIIKQGATTSTAYASGPATSTSAIPTASVCPTADGQVINGYTVKCSSDSTVGSYSAASAANSYLDCMVACDGQASSNCHGFVYVGGANGVGAGTCWLKTDVGAWSASGSNFVAARKPSASAATTTDPNASVDSVTTSTTSLASPSATLVCPDANNTIYTASTGSTFLIECGIDHAGGDIGAVGASSLNACIESCAANSACVDVSLSGTGCYLKGTLGAPVSNGVLGARLVNNTGPSANSTSVTLTTSSTPSLATSAASTMTSASLTATSALVLANSSTLTTTSISSGTSSMSQGPSSASTASDSILSSTTITTTTPTPTPTTTSTSTATATATTTTTSTTTLTTTLTTTPITTTSSATDPVSPGIGVGTDASSSIPATSSSVSPGPSSSATSATISMTLSSSTLSSVPASLSPSGTLTITSLVSTTTTSPSASVLPSLSSTRTTVSTSSGIASPASSSTSTTSSIITTSSASTTSTRSTTTSTLPTPSLPGQVSSLGCYSDSPRVFPTRIYSNSSNTPAFCALACRAAGYKYSGTEYSSECWCGNFAPSDSAVASSPSFCSMVCAGDKSQVCGGPNLISVASDAAWKPTFFARANYGAWNSMGCYLDTGSRTLSSGLAPLRGGSANATVGNCLDACTAQGMTWCGLEYYSECYGGRTAPDPSRALTGDPLALGCNYKCNGNATEACGGANRIQVFIKNGTSA